MSRGSPTCPLSGRSVVPLCRVTTRFDTDGMPSGNWARPAGGRPSDPTRRRALALIAAQSNKRHGAKSRNVNQFVSQRQRHISPKTV